jgi:hypothetical protein
MYKNCQKQFWYFYNDPDRYYGYGEGSSNPALQRGTDFHNSADSFFDNITEYSHAGFRRALPVGGPLHYYYDWFAKIEWERFCGLKVKEWFRPLACELKVEFENRTGHVDRVDRIGKKELQIVEYKTGKSYNMEKQWAVTKMNAEIGFYAQILKFGNYYPDLKITSWKVINPTLQKQWVNKISPISLNSVDKVMSELEQKILAEGEAASKLDTLFEATVTPLCGYCPYIKDCFYESNFDYERTSSSSKSTSDS